MLGGLKHLEVESNRFTALLRFSSPQKKQPFPGTFSPYGAAGKRCVTMRHTEPTT